MKKKVKSKKATMEKADASPIRQLERHLQEVRPEKGSKSVLMGLLHKTQEIYGYLPLEAMELISEKLSIPTAHIYGMATFYNYFSLKPKARYSIHVCKGTACYVAGGVRLLDKLKEELKISEGETTPDGLFSLNITRCLGCCGLSPVMQVNEEVYVRMSPEKIPAILDKYRKASRGASARSAKEPAGVK